MIHIFHDIPFTTNMGSKMNRLNERNARLTPESTGDKKRDETALDLSRVKIVALPRRNDDVYMRSLRRRTA